MDANADPHFLEMIFSEDEEDEEYVPTEMELKASVIFIYFLLLVIVFFSIYLFLGYIYLQVSLYIVCVSYQLNIRSTMEIRKSRLCDYFLVLLFIASFLY